MSRLDTRGFMDGALKGYSTLKGVQQNDERLRLVKERQDMTDARYQESDRRYENEQIRLSEANKRDQERYEEEKKIKAAERAEQKKNRDLQNKVNAANLNLSNVQLADHQSTVKRQKKVDYLEENAPVLQAATERFMATGELDPIFDGEHVKGSAYDPRSYTPQVVKSAYELDSLIPQVMQGKLAIDDESLLKPLNHFLSRNVKKSIGQTDEVTGKVIKDTTINKINLVNDINPDLEGNQPGVVIGLNVLYDDGSSKTAPVTEGRSTSPSDNVKVIPLEALMKDVSGQMKTAKQLFNSKHYARLYSSTGSKANQEIEKQWRVEISDLEQQRAKVFSEMLNPDEEQVAVINAQFDQARERIDTIYGKASGDKVSSASGQEWESWAGEDPAKQQFLNALQEQGLDINGLSAMDLEHNYNTIVTNQAKKKAAKSEARKEQSLAKIVGNELPATNEGEQVDANYASHSSYHSQYPGEKDYTIPPRKELPDLPGLPNVLNDVPKTWRR